MSLRSAEGKLILFAVDTGEQAEFWPIDAKALLASGTHTTEPPAGVTPVVPVAPPAQVPAPQAVVVQTFAAPEGEESATEPPKSRKKAG